MCGKWSKWGLEEMHPHHYEVYALAYGGRNSIMKVPEVELPKVFVDKVVKEYILNMKSMCMRFLTTHCSEEELRDILDVYGIKTNITYSTTPIYTTANKYSTPSSYASANIYKTKSNLEGLKQ